MRVLHLITAFDLGGAEESVSIIAGGFAGKGHDCRVASVTRTKDENGIGRHLSRRLSRSGVDSLILGRGHLYADIPLATLRLLNLVRRWKPDIVHSHTDIPDLVVALALRLRKFRVARSIRNSALWPTRRHMGFVCESAFRDDLIIHISPDAKKAYQDLRWRYRLAESAIQVDIPNPVETIPEEQYLCKAELVDRYSANENRIHFCFAGRFTQQKGFDVLIDAVAKLPRNQQDRFEIHAFGQGEELPAYKKRVADTGVPVKFHAPVPGISRLLRAFDAVIIPSRYEGLGRVAQESMAAAVPVIATTAPGLRYAIPPDWPLAVPPDDPAALARMIVDFIDGTYNHLPLTETAGHWAAEQFSLKHAIEMHEDAYRRLLAS